MAPEILFRHYLYFSSVSAAMVQHFAAYATHVRERFVAPGALVVEVGSNDGILLRAFSGHDVRILGVDPAVNVAEQARQNGVPTLAEFFGEPVAHSIVAEHGRAAVIIGNNVFAHIDDLHSVMRGIDALLAEDGVLVLEFPYVVTLLEGLEFDTVYHEHVSYLGTRPLAHLFARYGMEIFEVGDQDVHGGSVRVFARRRGGRPGAIDPSVALHDERERAAGIDDPVRLARFATEVASLRDELRRVLAEITGRGQRVVGYTAPAKGTVLLNYCGLDASQVAYLADATPAKQGRYVPGVRIPIRTPEHFRADQPDYALLLAWNHEREIVEKEAAFRAAGGKFIVAVPRVRIV
ncbi:MAG: methyltransferase domain-containing protein [Proteobacteria bacterium]|nr:MAG: methyltransferase domain-containing protein [Pseudomonadota bacterium]